MSSSETLKIGQQVRRIIAVVNLVLLPITASAESLVIDGEEFQEGDLVYPLLQLAGKPLDVRQEKICLMNGCTKTGVLERWIYIRDNIEYTVGVFDDRVTSITQHPLPASGSSGGQSESESE